MAVFLLDVNVLVAVFDPAHSNHERAHRWLATNKKRGWSTCPITINGCIRVLSNPAYPTVSAKPYEVAERLREFCDSPHHHFWTDSLALTDEKLFRHSMIRGHQEITDIYLLALAVRYHGTLATFDKSISLKAVRDAAPHHLALIGNG